MVGKPHCFYKFDEEVEEFYRPNTVLVSASSTVDEVGELHVNGKIYGHRMWQRYDRQNLRDPEEMKRMRRPALMCPGHRGNPSHSRDAIARKREYDKQKYISKRERRLVSRDYHPFADIHRGNAQTAVESDL
jgi:hypothetical protein